MTSRKETRIIPIELKELETGNDILVERVRVANANRFGRPQVDNVEDKTFRNFKEAIEWSLESPEYSHSFNIPLQELKLSARFSGDRRGIGETLKVIFDDKVGESPRNVDEHHGVSTDYENFFLLVINLGCNQSTLFDRGLAWLDLSNDKIHPNLKFNINAGIHTGDELKEGMIQLLNRVNRTLNDLVQS